METLPFLILLLIALGMAFLAKFILPHSVPGGFVSTTAVGFCGAWMGSSMLFHAGPDLAGIPLVASFVCATILIFFFSMISGSSSHSWD
ncbi:MAG: GlsB/YeaQ/YmgE family stress response membrane protein [Candidatus Melainabacteria bacterium]|nr:GlsB/YeaQ/YmgE family stress response membrane protein [Candidatus Melainabacteria bacterium]